MSDDRDWRQYTRRGALGLMGVGGLAVATETMGITQLQTDRDTAIDTAGDAASDVGLQVTDSNGDAIDDQTFTDAVKISFTNTTSNTLVSPNDLSVTLTGSNGQGSGKVDVPTSTNLRTDFNTPIESGDSATYDLDSNLQTDDQAELKLEINNPDEGEDSDKRDALDIDVKTDANLGDTTVEFTRSITIEDQSA
jgi:hypothetical protein